MSLRERFEITSGFRMWSRGLIGVGVLSLIIGFFVYGTGDDAHQAKFWGVLLHNSIYFLMVTNAVMFFFAATTLAMAGFQISFKRVTEAIAACVPVIGTITFIVLVIIVFGHKSMIYEWLDKTKVAKDAALSGKRGFLNPGFFMTWTIAAIGLWSLIGLKMRQISRKSEDHPMSLEEGKKFVFKNTVWAALFYCMVCAHSCCGDSLALDDELCRSLVLHIVQLVHFCEHFCCRRRAYFHICCVHEK